MFVLFQFLINLALTFVDLVTGAGNEYGSSPGIGTMISWAVSLGFFIPNLAVTARRLHDTNRTAWWMVAPLIPYLVLIVSVVGALSGGTGGLENLDFASLGGIALLSLVAAIVLGIVLLVFMCLDGTRGPNRYGPDPKGHDIHETFA